MNYDVVVNITQAQQAPVEGFGYPLVFAGMQTAETPYTECDDLEAVEALFAKDTGVYKAAALLFGQSVRPEKIAVYGTAGNALSETGLPAVWEEGWRQLAVASHGETGESTIPEIAAHLQEKDDKLYFASVTDLADVTGAGKAITEYSRLFCLYHPNEAEAVPEAAVLGVAAAYMPGEITYKNLVIAGLTPSKLTPQQLEAAHAAGCYAVVRKAGQTVTSEGQAADGAFLDILDSRDWVVQTLEYETQRALNDNPKVPYDNNGIALLESICVDVLARAAEMGIILTDADGNPEREVSYAPRSETQSADREARRYVEGRFSFTITGAVHSVRINGTINIP